MAAGRNSAVKPSNSVRWLLGETAPSNLQTLSDGCWEKQRRQTFKPCPMTAGRNSAVKPSNPVRWLLGETAPSNLQTLSDGCWEKQRLQSFKPCPMDFFFKTTRSSSWPLAVSIWATPQSQQGTDRRLTK